MNKGKVGIFWNETGSLKKNQTEIPEQKVS
jgi:hypothetical protein